MTLDVTIRAGRRDEAEALAELHLETALHAYAVIFPPEAPVPTRKQLVATWSDALRRTSVLVAEVDRDLGGVVCGGPDPLDDTVGHLSRLYVRPPLWGRGLGRALHDACIADLCDQGFELATLWVLDGNARARAWYERLGWKITGGYKPVYAPAGICDLRYRLLLTASFSTPRGDPRSSTSSTRDCGVRGTP